MCKQSGALSIPPMPQFRWPSRWECLLHVWNGAISYVHWNFDVCWIFCGEQITGLCNGVLVENIRWAWCKLPLFCNRIVLARFASLKQSPKVALLFAQIKPPKNIFEAWTPHLSLIFIIDLPSRMFRHGFRAYKRVAPRALLGVLNLAFDKRRKFTTLQKSALGIHLASIWHLPWRVSSYICCIWENVFEHLDVLKISQHSRPTTAGLHWSNVK